MQKYSGQLKNRQKCIFYFTQEVRKFSLERLIMTNFEVVPVAWLRGCQNRQNWRNFEIYFEILSPKSNRQSHETSLRKFSYRIHSGKFPYILCMIVGPSSKGQNPEIKPIFHKAEYSVQNSRVSRLFIRL